MLQKIYISHTNHIKCTWLIHPFCFIEKWTKQYGKNDESADGLRLDWKHILLQHASISFHSGHIKDFSETNNETQNNSWNTKNVKYRNT